MLNETPARAAIDGFSRGWHHEPHLAPRTAPVRPHTLWPQYPMRFEFTLGPSGHEHPRRRPNGVRRLLVLADLRGSGTAGPADLLDRPIVKVDLDNVDAVLARCAPVVQLGPDAGNVRIEIRTFDDFHPDRLIEHVPAFARLRDIRARLKQPSTFAAAVAELHGGTLGVPAATGSAPQLSAPESSAATLERLLGRTAATGELPATAPATVSGTVDALIRQAIAPHIVEAPSPQLPQMLAAVDAAMTHLMRAVLHDPAFQRTEATWRSIQWLVSTLELDETQQLQLLHVTRDELLAESRPDSALWRRLLERERQAGADGGYACVVCDATVGGTDADLAGLATLGALANALDAPFVASASPALVGSRSMADSPHPREWQVDPALETKWTALRSSQAADRVGLALPRVLLRLPYGTKSDRIGAFGFEEQTTPPHHEWFLWGNPAYLCGVVAMRALGDDAEGLDVAGFEGLPAFTWRDDDEPKLQPVAEIAPTEEAVVSIQGRGLMPVVSYKNRNAVRLVALHSISAPPKELI